MRWSGALLLAALLSGCGSLFSVAYNYGDIAVRMAADDYFALDDEQGDALRPQLARLHAWHRRSELPEYAALAGSVAQRLERGLTASDAEWTVDRVRTRYRVLAARAIDDVAPVLVTLNPANLQALEKKLAANNSKFERDMFAGTPARRQENRLRQVNKRFEDWIGELTREQRERIAQYVAITPEFSRERFEERKRRQRAIVVALAESPDAAQLASRLKRLIVDYDAERSIDERRLARELEQAAVGLVLDIDRMLTPAQRTRAAQRLSRYARDFQSLAAEGASRPLASDGAPRLASAGKEN